MNTKTDSLASIFVDRLLDSVDRIGKAEHAKARWCLLDLLGVMLAGAKDLAVENGSIAGFLSGSGTVRVIGTDRSTDPVTAALLNGINAHKLELDDGHRYGMVHPGAPVISALLPLVHAGAVDTDAFLRGIIVGYEATIRLAIAMQPVLKMKGYHATGICGAVGASIGAAVALGLSREQVLGTLAAACTQAAGLLEVIRDGSDLKPFNSGHAAMHGLVAVAMGQADFKGPFDVLAGRQGMMRALGGSPDMHVFDDIGRVPFAIHGIYVKPYAACRHAHPAVEAALVLRTEHGLEPEQIRSVRVHTYAHAVHLHDHREVNGAADAKMSTPYSVAVALCAGQVGMEQFTPVWMENEQVKRITQVVEVVEDPAMSARVPHERGARVEVVLDQGTTLEHIVHLPKGEPENPITVEELQMKFQGLAAHAGLSADQQKRVLDTIVNPDGDVCAMLAHL